MARTKTSPIEDVMLMAGKLPWWVGILLALVSYLLLHAIAARPVAPITGPGNIGDFAVKNLIKTMAMFGQLILPMVFVVGALISGISAARQKKLYNTVAKRTDVAVLNEMSWHEFEMLVGEHFRRNGFQVERQGGNGPDGGVDLVLRNKGETYLVQCKQWKAYKVGVQPVRELYGVMASRGAAGGYVVTSGKYTEEAREFANGLNVELIDGLQLRQIIDNARKPTAANSQQLSSQTIIAPCCPKCGADMKKRIARQGSNAGNEFWGCISYPKCNGIKTIDAILESQPILNSPEASISAPKPEMKNCPHCGSELVLRQFQSGPKSGQQFYGCVPCKKGWPVRVIATDQN